ARVGGIPSSRQRDQSLRRGVVGGGGAAAGGGVDRGPVHGELVGDQNPVDALTALDRLLVVGERAPGRGELLHRRLPGIGERAVGDECAVRARGRRRGVGIAGDQGGHPI